MATNDFIHDIVDKLEADGMEYMVVSLQKGKDDCKANAYYCITTGHGADMLLTTVNEVFSDEKVVELLGPELLKYSDDLEDASDSPNVEDVWPDLEDLDNEESE